MLQLSDGAHEPAALQTLLIIHHLHHQQGITIRDVMNSGERDNDQRMLTEQPPGIASPTKELNALGK